MEIVTDEVVDFFVHKFTSKAGKPCSVNKMNLKTFGEVSLGFTKPETLPFVAGDHVSINVEKNYGEWQYKGEAAAGSTATVSTAPTPAPKAGAMVFVPKEFPVPDKHGDMAIIHQNSLTNARALVCALIEQGAVDTDDPDAIVALIKSVAYDFVAFSAGHDLREK